VFSFVTPACDFEQNRKKIGPRLRVVTQPSEFLLKYFCSCFI